MPERKYSLWQRVLQVAFVMAISLAALGCFLFVILLSGCINPFVILEIRTVWVTNQSGEDVRITLIATPYRDAIESDGKQDRCVPALFAFAVPAIPAFSSENVLLRAGETRKIHYHAEGSKPSELLIIDRSGVAKFVDISDEQLLARQWRSGDSWANTIVVPRLAELPNATPELLNAARGRNIWLGMGLSATCPLILIVLILCYRKLFCRRNRSSQSERRERVGS